MTKTHECRLSDVDDIEVNDSWVCQECGQVWVCTVVDQGSAGWVKEEVI